MKTFSEVYETLPGDGWLSCAEAALLWTAATEAVGETGAILEVGCFKGRSTVLLSCAAHKVYAVDSFTNFHSDDASGEGIKRALIENLSSRGIVNVEVFGQRIEEWPARKVDFAYLDGDHTRAGTVSQIEKALACGAKSLAVHDVNDNGGGVLVKEAALELLGPWSQRVERLAVWGNVQ